MLYNINAIFYKHYYLFDNMEKYVEDGFNFFDVVKKFYDKELKMVSNLGAKLILNRNVYKN